MTDQQDKLLCPCCGERRRIAQTPLLAAEAAWSIQGASDLRRPPGWSVVAARSGQLQWACTSCIREGRALAGHPVLQTWCDFNPYFAFIDANLWCDGCGQPFVFTAAEQHFWYETLKFWVQSRPKRCIPCRPARRAQRRLTGRGPRGV